jgi:hypothetical protein
MQGYIEKFLNHHEVERNLILFFDCNKLNVCYTFIP